MNIRGRKSKGEWERREGGGGGEEGRREGERGRQTEYIHGEMGSRERGWACVRACVAAYIPRNMHAVFALLCFVVVIHWLIFPYPSGLLHWHCGILTIAPVPAKQPWWIWINTSCEFFMNDCITTTKQSTTKPCAYFLGYTVCCIAFMYIVICTVRFFSSFWAKYLECAIGPGYCCNASECCLN